jgi:hypothetical protein
LLAVDIGQGPPVPGDVAAGGVVEAVPLLAMPGMRPMTTDSPGQPSAIEGERVARAGARWTREEEEQLVVEVRAGTDLAEIAG